MTVTIHDLYAVKIDAAVLGAITDHGVDPQTTIGGAMSDGAVYRKTQHLNAQNPRATFSSLACAAALDLCGLLGYDLSAGAGLTLYAQKHAAGGTREGTLSHKSYLMREGLLVPRRLTVSHQEDAKIDYEALATYDGTNDPVDETDSITLPADPNEGERFTLGKITVGGTVINHVRSVEIDFGIDARAEGADSDIWPTHASIFSIQPMITIRGVNPLWFAAAGPVPLTGKVLTHADTTVYLRKRAPGGTYVADGTAEHISITVAGGADAESIISGRSNEPQETGVRLTSQFDGTNPPLVIDTTAGIV